MARSQRIQLLVIALVLGLLPTAALAGSGPGTWRTLAPEPVALPYGGHVWTGSELFVFGRRPLTHKTFNPSVNAAMTFDPVRNAWKTLAPPAQVGVSLSCCDAVWTGKEALVFGANLGYNPRTDSWRPLRAAGIGGIVLWTGREAIGWGGGCCGDARATGAAYNPVIDKTRALPRSPLAPSQEPLGVWDGREALLFVSGYDPEGKPYPAGFARAAAYDPSQHHWRRIASLPAPGPRFAGAAVWTGREVLVAGTGRSGRATFAYNPATNRWRHLAQLPSSRAGAQAVWTAGRLVVWGGEGATPAGVSYDPRTNRWSSLPQPPLRAPESAAAVWTGRSLLAFGGIVGSSAATGNQQVWLRGVAAFTPAGRRS
jgi:hypothetical protein